MGDETAVTGLVAVPHAHYELLGEFARGGLGRIFRARDRRTGRVVAIKEVLHDDDDVRRRFAREALVTANLQHPSIVPVYEVGRWPGGEPFFAMKLVRGRSLDDLVAETPEVAARVALLPHVIDVAEALAYAHGEGVIHRDLKPSNVLVGAWGETVVIDWGLARRAVVDDAAETLPRAARHHGDAVETAAGSVLGTPAYMPPEQARGEVVDARADVYAIGAILYFVLGGARPYAEAAGADAVLRRVTEGPPRPLGAVAPELPPELVAICARAMAPRAADRYPTAQGLAEDLRRFEAGQLVRAHRYTPRELAARWLRRNRALAATAAVALAGAGTFGAYSVARIRAERDEATRQRAAAVRAGTEAERRLGEGLEELGRQALVAGDPTQALPLLAASWERRAEGPAALRFLSGRARDVYATLRAVAPGGGAATLWAARTPDGATLLRTGFDRTLRAWDLRARRPRWSRPGPLFARLSPDGRRVAGVDAEGVVSVWAVADGALLHRETLAAGEEMQSMDWSPDGARLAVGGRSGTLGVWPDGGLGRGVILPRAHAERIRDLRFSPDGARLATAGDDGAVVVWDARAAGPAVRLAAPHGRVNSVAWLGGDRVVSGADDGAVVVWDVSLGLPLRTLEGGASVYRVAVDPARGRVAAALVDTAARVWNAESGAPIATLPGHRGSANDAVFSGAQLLTADEAGAVRRWDVSTGALVATLPPEGLVFSVIAADGHVVIAGQSPRVRVVADVEDPAVTRLVGHAARSRQALFDPTGETLYTASNDGTARAWDASRGAARFAVGAPVPEPERPYAPGAPPPANPHGIRAIALSPDGRALVTAAEDGAVAVWDAATGALRGRLEGHVGRVRDVALSPDGRRVATAGSDGTARVWELATRRPLARLEVGAALQSVRFDRDGARVIALAEDLSLSLWDLRRGARVDDGSLPASRLVELPLAADGALLTAQPDAVRVVDPRTGAIVRTVPIGMATSAEPSPDGRELLLGAAGGEAYLVSARDGATRRAWTAHDGVVTAARFRPDGALLATLGMDATVRVWETATGRLLAASRTFPGVALYLRWSPDGRRLAVAGLPPEVWVWQVAPDPGDPASVARRARCASPWRLEGTAVVAAPSDPAACE